MAGDGVGPRDDGDRRRAGSPSQPTSERAGGTGSLADADPRLTGEAGDVDTDGLPDVLIGAEGHSSAGASAGAACLIWGADALTPSGT